MVRNATLLKSIIVIQCALLATNSQPAAAKTTEASTFQITGAQFVKPDDFVLGGELSPTGKYLADVRMGSTADSSNLEIIDSASLDANITEHYESKIHRVCWMSDSATVVYLAKSSRNATLHLFATNLPKKVTRDLTPFSNRTATDFYLTEGRKNLFVKVDLERKGEFVCFQVDTVSGALTKSDPKLVSSTHDVIAVKASPEDLVPSKDTLVVPRLVTYDLPTMAGQEQLARQLKSEADKLIRLSDEPSIAKADDKPKAWSSTEKEAFLKVWACVVNRAPALVVRARHGNALSAIRAQTVISSADINGRTDGAAAARYGTILITDQFFSPGYDLVPALAHELGHLADLEGHLSQSKEWVALQKTRIERVRSALKISKTEGLQILDDHGSVSLGLPSLYAATSYSESLAEWTRLYVEGKSMPGSINKFIEDRVINLHAGEEASDEVMMHAIEEFRAKKYAESIKTLSQVIRMDPEFLQAYADRARAYEACSKTEEARADWNHLLTAAETRGITPESESRYAAAWWYGYAEFCWKTHDYTTSLRDLNRLLAVDPTNETYRVARSFVESSIARTSKQK